MLRAAIGLVIAAVLLAGMTAAVAAEDEAERLIKRGVELRKKGDDQEALKLFKRAHEISPTPRAAAQLGLAEQAVGRWEDADTHIAEALQSPADPWIVKNSKALNESLLTVREHIGWVEVIGEPPGAEVYVNGRLAGRLPLADPVRVSAGQIEVEVRAPGYASGSRSITIAGRQTQSVVLRLARETLDTPDKPRPTVVVAPPPQKPLVVERTSPEVVGPSPARRTAKWVALGAAAAGLGVGVVASILRESNVSKVKDASCFDRDGQAVNSSGAPVASCQGSLDAAATDRTIQVLGFIGAGVFAATWLALTLTEPAPSSREKHARLLVTCAPTIASAGLLCEGRF